MIRTLKTAALSAALILLTAARCGDERVTPPPTPPATPTGLAAAPGDAEVTLSWDANTEATLAGYTLYWGADPDDLAQTRFVAAPDTTATIDNLTNGIEYHFAIDAEDVSGLRSARSEIVTAVPQATVLEAPVVTATQPQNGDTDVPINTAIRVTFSKAMDGGVTEGAFSAEPTIACTFSWNLASTTLTCTPTEPLSESTGYTVTIDTTAQDTEGNGLAQAYSFSFTTGDTALAVCTFGTSEFGACIFGH